MTTDYEFCISSYLAFRYVAKPGIGWAEGVVPRFPDVEEQGRVHVKTPSEVLEELRGIASESLSADDCGVLLSAGMDSAIIAALMPPGTRSYTIRFVAEGAVDESPAAEAVASRLGLRHTVVDVTWRDYLDSMDSLMKQKKAPLHPAEVGLYRAACVARQDGVRILAVGNGADSTFGGMDKLLSRDWTFDEFVERYTFLEPARAAKTPVSVVDVYEPYRTRTGARVPDFLKVVHGLGIVQMFENAIQAGGCSLVAPFEELVLDAPLDLQRIRGGEPKYILNSIFRSLFPGVEVPAKIPFARPVAQWLADWKGPTRGEFLDDLSMDDFTGEQKWQLYCLERFLSLLQAGEV
jgi:asparagine synthetase B (glutamine-hydrolysing)